MDLTAKELRAIVEHVGQLLSSGEPSVVVGRSTLSKIYAAMPDHLKRACPHDVVSTRYGNGYSVCGGCGKKVTGLRGQLLLNQETDR